MGGEFDVLYLISRGPRVQKCNTKAFRKHNYDLFYSLVHSLGNIKQIIALNLSLAHIYKTTC